MTRDSRPDEFGSELTKLMRKRTRQARAAAVGSAQFGAALAVVKTGGENLVDLGGYKNAWKGVRVHNGAEVINDAPYAGVIEFGRRPGRPGPPLAPILAWVESKLVRGGEVAEEDARSVAFAIRAKIHRDGTPPRLVLTGTKRAVTRHFRSAMRRIFGGR